MTKEAEIGLWWPSAVADAAAILKMAADAFDTYAQIHARKEPSFENGMKAAANIQLAVICRSAQQRLAQYGGVKLVQVDNPDVPRPLAEWHEDMGECLWWKFPITEAPYVGSPLDTGTLAEVTSAGLGLNEGDRIHVSLGAWPGYHTHFTRIAMPKLPGES